MAFAGASMPDNFEGPAHPGMTDVVMPGMGRQRPARPDIRVDLRCEGASHVRQREQCHRPQRRDWRGCELHPEAFCGAGNGGQGTECQVEDAPWRIFSFASIRCPGSHHLSRTEYLASARPEWRD
ncbi:MAG: hypothetical protein MUO63_12530 [Desulfobulbaceae bacterium]|nr:hypothetical protein [Desulfobulbaceae bacterium]